MELGGELQATLDRLELSRQASRSRMWAWMTAVALASAVVALMCFADHSNLTGLLVLLAGGIAAFVLYNHLTDQLRKAFKEQVLPMLLQRIDPSLSYQATGFVGKDEFNQSELYSRPDRYAGKDLVQGRVGQTAVRFSMVHAEEEYDDSRTDSDGKTVHETSYRTLFRGLFFIADFNKHFAGRTLVKPQAVSFISRMFGSHVALEDPAFNTLFTVNTTDQVEARYILTPSLMERLKHLRVKAGAFRVSFSQGSLYMAIDMAYGAFEPDVSRSLQDAEQVQQILDKLTLVTGIVEDLGLNVRIWTKVASPGAVTASA